MNNAIISMFFVVNVLYSLNVPASPFCTASKRTNKANLDGAADKYEPIMCDIKGSYAIVLIEEHEAHKLVMLESICFRDGVLFREGKPIAVDLIKMERHKAIKTIKQWKESRISLFIDDDTLKDPQIIKAITGKRFQNLVLNCYISSDKKSTRLLRNFLKHLPTSNVYLNFDLDLDLFNSQIKAPRLNIFVGLKNIRGLWLSSINADSLKLLPELHYLKEFHLGCKIPEDSIRYFTDLKWLEILDIDIKKLTANGVKLCSRIDSLERLPRGDFPPGSIKYVSKLKNLRTLTTSGSAGVPIQDDEMHYLSELKELRVLHLSGGQFSDRGLKHLKALSELQELGLEVSEKTDLEYLHNLNKLCSLTLWGTPTPEAIRNLHNCKNLEEIVFAGWPTIDTDLIEAIAGCNSLTEISFSGCRFERDAIASFRRLRGIEKIEFVGVTLPGHTIREPRPLTSAILKYISEINSLRVLYFMFVRIIGDDLKYISELENLERLEVYLGRKSNGIDFEFFCGLDNLETLSVWGTDLNRSSLSGFSFIPEMPKLKKVRLEGVEAEAFKYIGKLENLEQLEVTLGGAFEGEAFKYIGELENLKELQVSVMEGGRIERGGQSLFAYLSNCKKLRKLAVSYIKVDGCDFVQLSFLKGLKELTITELEINKDVFDDIEVLHSLEKLRLGLIGGDGKVGPLLIRYCSELPELQQLFWTGKDELMGRITDDSVPFLCKMNNLRYLVLVDADITDTGVLQIRRNIGQHVIIVKDYWKPKVGR